MQAIGPQLRIGTIEDEMPEETNPQPKPRLPERDSEILAPDSKLKFVLNKKGELRILGNRLGLKALAAICSGLSESAEDDHYHLDEHFWGTDPGSIPTVVYLDDEL